MSSLYKMSMAFLQNLQPKILAKMSIIRNMSNTMIITIVVLLLSTFFMVRRLLSNRKRAYWEGRAHLHRTKRQSDKIKDFLTKGLAEPPQNLADTILKSNIKELVEKMQSGQWECTQVLLAYIHAAIETHQKLNCLTEILFEEALQRAQELDKLPFKERQSKSLFGIPISLKDTVDVAGYPTSLGTFRWAEEARTSSAFIYDNLIAAGAVPFCKTNVPQTLMSFECSNPLWGRTENPHKSGYSPGGSSGGEAALIGGGGSVAGIGSDIGGSLRIPAHFSGICTLKPSSRTLPTTGCRGFHPAALIIRTANGPMARTVEDLVPLMDACVGKVVAPHLNDVDSPLFSHYQSPSSLEPKRKLRIGVLEKLNFLHPLPPCSRALNEAVEALRADGHEIVPFSFPFPDYQLIGLFYKLISADCGFFYRDALKNEPIEDFMAPFMALLKKSRPLLWFYQMLTNSYADRRPYYLLSCLPGPKNAIELTHLARARLDLISALNEEWHRLQLDCLLTPAFATVAIKHGFFPAVSFAAAYTFIWNVVDYVAGVLPVTRVDAQLDHVAEPTPEAFDTKSSRRLWESEMENAYNSQLMEGLPVGVQVVTPQYHEKEALEAMLILESALKKKTVQQ